MYEQCQLYEIKIQTFSALPIFIGLEQRNLSNYKSSSKNVWITQLCLLSYVYSDHSHNESQIKVFADSFSNKIHILSVHGVNETKQHKTLSINATPWIILG